MKNLILISVDSNYSETEVKEKAEELKRFIDSRHTSYLKPLIISLSKDRNPGDIVAGELNSPMYLYTKYQYKKGNIAEKMAKAFKENREKYDVCVLLADAFQYADKKYELLLALGDNQPEKHIKVGW